MTHATSVTILAWSTVPASGPTPALASRPCPDEGAAGAEQGIGPAVDGREQDAAERRDGVGHIVDTAQDLAFDLECHQPMATLDLDGQLSDLDSVPADDLGGGARALARRR